MTTNAKETKSRMIKCRVSDAEQHEIEERAASVGMTLSAYMRAAALNHPIRAQADWQAVKDMLKVAADLGRIAGLLKLWLTERNGEGAASIDVARMMKDFRQLQGELRDKAGSILYDR